MENHHHHHNSRRSHFVRNGEGTSSVRLRRRKDMATNSTGAPPPSTANSDFSNAKKRNRHSGDFYHWNYGNNIVIPVNRFSMFENDLSRVGMETLDRRIPETELWKVPVLSRPPISGTGHRILQEINRRSCDLSGSTGKLLDNDDVKTDVNRNVTSNEKMLKVKNAAAAKKYHHKKASKSELQLHRNSHQFLENQSLVMSSLHNKSESKLHDSCNLMETNTEVSLVTGVEYDGGPEALNSNSSSSQSTVLKGVLWQQRDKVFSRWKERYFVLTTDYLQCFKKSSPSVMHSAASEMGRFIFKLRLTEINSVDLLDKRGYLTICLHLSKEGSKILLRKPEGIRDWHEALKTCITKSRERKGLMKSTKEFWSKKHFDNASQYSSDHWLISRTGHHARGNYLGKKDPNNTAMVDYGFIDAPKPRPISANVNNTKELLGNHNYSRNALANGGKKSHLEEQKQQASSMEVHHHHHSSSFGTKDSSDSKSHDSGIDSIEKPGRSPVSYSSTTSTKDDSTTFNNHQDNVGDKGFLNSKPLQKLSSAELLADNFASMVQMQERTPSFRRQPRNNATVNRRPKSSYLPSTGASAWTNVDPSEEFGTVIQRPQITKL